ncbi:MAG: C-GCAxxG-C-C family protein [Peptococcaceae bacterium]|nr:C-GCAxxG-C-C family protein [Peptococcaceae bacterium]
MAKDPTDARNRAGDYFRNGYNCAESIFLAFRDWLGLDVPVETVRALTGFGGGLGHAGCMCGALTGSAVVLGLLRGRTSAEESRDQAYALSKEFHDRFETNFGYTCCRSLNPHPFDTKEHLRHCIKITGNTGKLLAEFINEKGLAG